MCDRPPFTSRAVSRSIDLLITTVIWRIWNIVGLVLVRWIHQCKSPEFKITGTLSIKRVISFFFFWGGGTCWGSLYVVWCAIWYRLYNLENVQNIHGGALLLVTILYGRFHVFKTVQRVLNHATHLIFQNFSVFAMFATSR